MSDRKLILVAHCSSKDCFLLVPGKFLFCLCFELLRLQPLTLLNPPPLQEEECKSLEINNVRHSPS